MKTKKSNPSPSPDKSIRMQMGLREWGSIAVLAFIWGGSFFFNAVAIPEITPLTIVLFRIGIAAVVLVAYVYATGRKMPASPALWKDFIIMGALNNMMPFSLITWGQTRIQSGTASILVATTPIFSVLLAHFLTRDERLTINRAAGVVIGWTGVAVLIGVEFIGGVSRELIGQIAVLGAGFCFANAAIFGRRFKSIPPPVVAAGMLCGGTLLIIPLTLMLEAPWRLSPGPAAWAAISGLSIVSTAVAYIIYFRVLAVAGATNIMLVTFLIPVSAVFLGVFVLGEHLGWNAFVGMGCIFSGLIAIDGRLLKKITNRWYALSKSSRPKKG